MADQDENRLKVIRDFGSEITSAKDKAADAAMVVASIYKRVDDKGLHRKAMKQAIALRKLEPADFAIYWRELRDYLEAFGMFDQPDLFLDARPVTVEVKVSAPTEDKKKAEVSEPPKDKKAAKPKPADDDFGSVSAKELGKRAGLAGKGRDQNPSAPNSLDAQMWDSGWTEGHQELVDAAAKADPANSRPKRQRAALTEDGVAAPPPVAAAVAPAAEMVH